MEHQTQDGLSGLTKGRKTVTTETRKHGEYEIKNPMLNQKGREKNALIEKKNELLLNKEKAKRMKKEEVNRRIFFPKKACDTLRPS